MWACIITFLPPQLVKSNYISLEKQNENSALFTVLAKAREPLWAI